MARINADEAVDQAIATEFNSSTEYARAHMSRNEWRIMLRAEYEVWLRSVVRQRRPSAARKQRRHARP